MALLIFWLIAVYFVIGWFIAKSIRTRGDRPLRITVMLLWPTILVLYLVYLLLGGGRTNK